MKQQLLKINAKIKISYINKTQPGQIQREDPIHNGWAKKSTYLAIKVQYQGEFRHLGLGIS